MGEKWNKEVGSDPDSTTYWAVRLSKFNFSEPRCAEFEYKPHDVIAARVRRQCHAKNLPSTWPRKPPDRQEVAVRVTSMVFISEAILKCRVRKQGLNFLLQGLGLQNWGALY